MKVRKWKNKINKIVLTTDLIVKRLYVKTLRIIEIIQFWM